MVKYLANINSHIVTIDVNGTLGASGIKTSTIEHVTYGTGSSGEVITSDGNGGWSWSPPNQIQNNMVKPLFQVFGINTLVATGDSGIYKLVNWSTPTIDQEAGSFGWDSTNSNYRCPLAGNYRVSTLIQWQGNNITHNKIGIYIYLNNSQYGAGFSATTFHDVLGVPEYQFACLNYIIPCSQGDTIDSRSDAKPNLNIDYAGCHFNVEFIQNSTSGGDGGGGGVVDGGEGLHDG